MKLDYYYNIEISINGIWVSMDDQSLDWNKAKQKYYNYLQNGYSKDEVRIVYYSKEVVL